MIGGISYFHEFAYDLLAENERILAATFDAAIAAHRDRAPGADHRRQLVDGLRVGDGLPDAGGRPADLAAADLHLRLPEARLGVLRQGRLGAVPAAVHDRPAVQLRRDRRAPGAARHGHHERQREAGPVPRRARTSSSRSSRARTRSTSWATGNQVRHYTYGGDLAHGIRLAMESPAAVNDDFNLSTAASTTVLELAEAIWHKIHGRRPAVPLRQRRRRSSTTSSSASRTSARHARSSASRRRRRSTRCSTRSSRGSAPSRRPGRL